MHNEFRDARLACLKQDLLEHHNERVVWKCRQLDSEPDALHNELFVEYWMIAAYRTGNRLEALRIYERAAKAVQEDLGASLTGRLHQLARIIQSEGEELDGPANLLEWVSPGAAHDFNVRRRPMGEDKFTINFNNHAGSSIEEQIGHVETINKNVTINNSTEPDQADVKENSRDGKPDQAHI